MQAQVPAGLEIHGGSDNIGGIAYISIFPSLEFFF